MEKKKVLLIDDHELVRVGLGLIIAKDPELEVVAYAKNKNESMDMMKKYFPDVAVIDIRLKGESGIEICKEITRDYPGTKVLMLTSFGDDELIIKSIKAGASGYLLKQVSNNEILRGLKEVADGGCLFDPATTARVMNIMRNKVEDKKNETLKERLSDKEYKILSLLGEGKTNTEIGETLQLSTNTVKNYVSNLLTKLELHNRSEAAVFAVNNNVK